jgi:shikimate dehydrogenase
VGLSVTMPGKFAALQFAAERTRRAELVGSANTLLHTETGWRADNTDVDGVMGALGTVIGGQERSDRGFRIGGQERSDRGFRIGRAAVLGSGGTAPAAVVGLAELGITDITVVARNPDRAQPLVALGHRLGIESRWTALGTLMADLDVDVVVSTLPADVAAQYAATVIGVPLLLDAIYDPWPTQLAQAVEGAGGRVVSGLQMLLHQAFAQVEQFTGQSAPKEVMSAALG